MNNFVKRTLSAIGFAAVMLAALLTNKFVFGFVMLLSLVVMMKEFLHMTCGSEYRYSQILSILSGATFAYQASTSVSNDSSTANLNSIEDIFLTAPSISFLITELIMGDIKLMFFIETTKYYHSFFIFLLQNVN